MATKQRYVKVQYPTTLKRYDRSAMPNVCGGTVVGDYLSAEAGGVVRTLLVERASAPAAAKPKQRAARSNGKSVAEVQAVGDGA